MLNDLENLLQELVPAGKPDLIIYLRLSPERALARLRARSRDEECHVGLVDLIRLYNRYEEWIGPNVSTLELGS